MQEFSVSKTVLYVKKIYVICQYLFLRYFKPQNQALMGIYFGQYLLSRIHSFIGEKDRRRKKIYYEMLSVP